MTRKIRIHNPEDVDMAHDNAKFVIASLFNDECTTEEELLCWLDSNFEVRRFICARDAISYYDSDGATAPDLLLCDIDFSEEQCGETRTAGVDIVLKVRDKFPDAALAYLTGQETEDNEIRPTIEAKLWEFLPSESRIVRKDSNSTSADLRRKLPVHLTKIARSYLERASFDELDGLWNVLKSAKDPLNAVVPILKEDWVVKDLFIGYKIKTEKKMADDGSLVIPEWKLLTDKEFAREINDQVAHHLSITYHFSNCFGRWGVKELTHGTPAKSQSQGYYYSDHRLADCVEQQLVDLSNVIDNVWAGVANQEIKKIIENFEEFTKTWQQNRDRSFSEELRESRNRHFQVSGSNLTEYIKKLRPSVVEAEVNISSLEDFEIHLPIHFIFGGALSQMLNPKDKELGKTEILCKGSRILKEKIPDVSYASFLFDNHLLIRHELLLNEKELTTIYEDMGPVHFLTSFHNQQIERYGKYYIILRNESVTYYDVTRSDIRLVSRDIVFGADPHPLESIIHDSAEFKTHHLFILTAWRQ